jgi:hypothetical protein
LRLGYERLLGFVDFAKAETAATDTTWIQGASRADGAPRHGVE